MANHSSNEDYAELMAKLGIQFLARYGNLSNVNWGWYLTEEGSLPQIGLNPEVRNANMDYISTAMKALKMVRPLPFLWSPSNGDITPANTSQWMEEETGLREIFCNLPSGYPLALHFQDWLGQSVSFEFPFNYNYSQAFTCTRNTVPTVRMLERVQNSCPDKLVEVKVNVEFFAERLNDGMHGEDNGANIVNANPAEIASRLDCYRRNNLAIGACWAISHWYSIFTFANETVYHPY